MDALLVTVDAFTATPFSGNPAAVCIINDPREESWMQAVAAEMNLSETAFLQLLDNGNFSLRWFTPAVEVALCGHATLASAHALWSQGIVPSERPIRFETKSGILTATRAGDWIELDFPSKPETHVEPPTELLPALGITAPVYIGRNAWDYLVEVQSEEIVRSLAPDFARLRALRVRGIMVTSRGSGQYDFISRFFAPGSGIDEDPVTGSAHCCLTPYWAQRLGKTEMTAFQASARGGVVRVRLDGDRVKLGGQAVTVMRGTLSV